MKYLLLLGLVISSFTISAQNLIYLERLNSYSDFASGTGQVNVNEVGVSPSLDIYVKYDRLGTGSTGWISHTGTIYTDVYGTGFSAIGVYSNTGDTVIKSHQEFSVTNYEITDVVTTGFDAYGQIDILENPMPSWTVDITFSGPDNNCDASVQVFIFPAITAVNNLLNLSNANAPIPSFDNPIYFNGQSSYNTLAFIDTINQLPTYPTGNLLNAYIPRVVNRPATVSDCNGAINFERVAMASDVSLEYSINSSPFAPLTSDQLTGLCGYDTIDVIGFSPTVLIGDTLVKTSYVLRSIDSASVIPTTADIEYIDLALNVGVTDPQNCENKIDFSFTQGSLTGAGFVGTEDGEYILVDFYIHSGLGNLCQGKYSFFSVDDSYMSYAAFSFTILDDANQLNDFLFSLEILPEYEDTLSCTTDIHVTRPTGPAINTYLNKVEYTSSGGQFTGNTSNQSSYVNSKIYTDLCPGLYYFETPEKAKYTIVTDSMQRLSINYDEIIASGSNGYADTYVSLPNIDTLMLIYEECTNNYSQPFNSVLYNMTTPQRSDLLIDLGGGGSTGFGFDEFQAGFNLTQNGNQINLHQRDVLVPYYDYPPGQYPYYIIAEMYCDTTLKAGVNRRRIVIEPNGQIHDYYGGSLSVYNDFSELNGKELLIYPNPTSNEFFVDNIDGWDVLNVYDLKGELIYSKSLIEGETTIKIDMSMMDSGTYIVETSGNRDRQRKILVKM